MFQVAVFCLGVGGALVAMLVNSHQPDPYMDEVFHIPQVQAYCRGNFSHWDPMITTLPGLYLSSVAWLSPVSRLLGMSTESLCQSPLLRAQNLISSLLLFLCLYWLHRKLHSTSISVAVLSSVNMTLFPVLYFFSFLYYTDTGATLLVLLGYALSLRGNHLLSAIVLLFGVCFRQTSIVWLVFVGGAAAVEIIEPTFTKHTKGDHLMLSYPAAIVKSLLSHLLTLLLTLWPYLAVVLLFATFIVLNGSLVMGDKTHHVPCLHLPQLFYLAVFTCVFSSPHILLHHTSGLLRALITRLKWSLALVFIALTGALAVHYFTYAHPYLLADNRHYPFYLWKNVFRVHPTVRYWLLPLYSASITAILYTLSRTRSFLWILLFTVCCFMTVVPQRLLEFRYFIIPYLMYRLHMPSGHGNNMLPLLAELLLYSCVNVFTLYAFLYKPFLWPDSQHLQRFMW